MFDKDNILRSPREVAQDANATEPLRLVLEDPHKARWTKLLIITLVCGALVIAAGFAIYGYAVFGGHANDPGFWHVSLVALLFWIGLTQGMVALSVILRITHASWRYPLNRLLDMASLFGLWGPLLLPLMALVRHRIYGLGVADTPNNVWRLFDPLVWDNLAVGSAYLAGWMLLYLTALPDFAVLRDRAPEGSKEKRFYQRIAGFWRGSEHQWRVLRRAEGVSWSSACWGHLSAPKRHWAGTFSWPPLGTGTPASSRRCIPSAPCLALWRWRCW